MMLWQRPSTRGRGEVWSSVASPETCCRRRSTKPRSVHDTNRTGRKTEVDRQTTVTQSHTHTLWLWRSRGSVPSVPLVCVVQVADPSAVLLLSCSPKTLSTRLQCRRRSSTDRDSATHRTLESFTDNSQEVAAYYQRKRLLHTVTTSHGAAQRCWDGY